MAAGQPINQELGLSEVISKTFELYRRNFTKYFVVSLIVNTISGIVTFLALGHLVLSGPPANPTPQQASDYLTSVVGPFISYLLLIVLLSIILSALAEGIMVIMASDDIKGGHVDLSSSVRFGGSKLLSIVALQILLSILVGLGSILIVPGIILAIMFCLSMPALLIEGAGVTGSFGRSRELVSHRWLKTFATFLVLGLIIAAIVVVSLLIGLAFGTAAVLVSGIIGSVYGPLLPIALTVYYYSNVARVSSAQVVQASFPTVPGVQPGLKYCSNCGTRMPAAAVYCPNCGIRTVP